MKLSRKVIAGFSAAALLAMAGTFFSCKSDDEDPHELINVDGDNATIDSSHGGEAVDSSDTKVANSDQFIRGFKTPNTSGWKSAVYKLQISSDSKDGVLGFVFDETKVEGTNGAENTYSFYLLGVRATTNSPSVYLSRFEDVQQSGLSGSGTSFGTEYTMIDSGVTSGASSGSKWYYQLPAGNDGFPYVDNVATLYVAFKQPTETKGYSFGIFKSEADAKTWYNSNSEGTKDNASVSSVITTLNAANKAVDDGTFVDKFTKTVDSYTYTPAITDFNVEYPKTAFRKNQVGFYAMIPRGGSLKGSWTKVDRDILEDEVVEE